MLLHRDPRRSHRRRQHLLREREADEERARARALPSLSDRGARDRRARPLSPLRPPRAVRPRVVVAQPSPEPPAFSVKGDSGQEERVEVLLESCFLFNEEKKGKRKKG